MGDEDDRREFIKFNLKALTNSTVIGTEFVIGLFANSLINEEEKHNLQNVNTSNIARAHSLYTAIANKWSQTQFEVFKRELKASGNLLALQVFTNVEADVFLTNDQVQLLKEQRDQSEGGCFEGLSREDELNANRVVQMVRSGGMFTQDWRFKSNKDCSRKEVIPLVKHFAASLKNKVIWWNPRKPQIPSNYIKRRVARSRLFNSDGTLAVRVQLNLLSVVCKGNEKLDSDDLTDDGNLVLLVDPPGMGKSSEVTDLEKEIRNLVTTTNRVIVRVNLNEVQSALLEVSECLSASSVLLKLAPFLPPSSLQDECVPVFVLLDGVDEVCPKHQDAMIQLLQILKPSDRIRVLLTTRPHLRAAIESTFNLKSWSLCPLTKEEQDNYIISVGISSANLHGIRETLPQTIQFLLSNPLMLSILTQIFQAGGAFCAGKVNTFDLYTRFVESKHKFHLVQKQNLGKDNQFTESLMGSMLEKNLPHYFNIAIRELTEIDKHKELKSIILEEFGEEESSCSEVTKNELLSVGLLVQYKNKLVFKHRSFAEFFYAKILLTSNLRKRARDAIFYCLYSECSGMKNVEALLAAAATSTLFERRPDVTVTDAGTSTHPSRLLLFTLTPQWLLIEKLPHERCSLLNKFVGSKVLFPILAPEVLMSFVEGDPQDQREVFQVLLHEDTRHAFTELMTWMSDNKEWCRRRLLRISECEMTVRTPRFPPVVARLIVAIGVIFGSEQQLLTEKEVSVAVNSIEDELVSILIAIHNGEIGVNKWDFVERHLLGGRSQLKEIMKTNADCLFTCCLKDKTTAWKLVSIFSHEELFDLLINSVTRVNDIVGRNPREVIVALGDQFFPRKQMAEFRFKFQGDDEGKTVFELKDLCGFWVEYLWEDIVEECKSGGEPGGPVYCAMREALVRMRGNSWVILKNLEAEVRRRRSSPHEGTMTQVVNQRNEDQDQTHLCMVIDWVTKDLKWNRSVAPYSIHALPFFLRYCRDIEPKYFIERLHKNKQILRSSHVLTLLFRSLMVSSFQATEDEIGFFSELGAFLLQNLTEVHPQLRPLVEVFARANMEEIKEAVSSTPSHFLVGDVSVGGFFLKLTRQQPLTLQKQAWEVLLCDAIRSTPSSEFQAAIQELQDRMNLDEEDKKEVLTSEYVLRGWEWRFSSKLRNSGEVNQLLSFYFSVFGLNLGWMKMQSGQEVSKAEEWILLKRFPVEISVVLQENPNWTPLFYRFQQILAEFFQQEKVNNMIRIAEVFNYNTRFEWERLLNIIDGENLLQPRETEKDGPSFNLCVFAPLIRAGIKLYGVEWTRTRLTQNLWNRLFPHDVEVKEKSLDSMCSLLHSVIELEELKEIERRTFAGLILSWENEDGQNALDVSKEKFEENHPIRVLLQNINSN